ncbi:M20 family metallopeptidase [Thioclava atlantica]|uniref:Probable succinyl-diaminopimelate desuccinylase n=1 Tax=Thioclava atlantica TaxID=1317124 RepID=A0A085TZY6_9RHOB|nr:M20 family metallopeptidase [Thioclava atlantica]KFE36283.1 peptidase M20:peptidase M20 [Thioclava atlantica]
MPPISDDLNAPADVVALTRRLMQFDTINPPGNEAPCAQVLRDLLDAAGFETRLYPFGAGRANLVAWLGNGSAPQLGFTGHLDTVPLGAQDWRHDPFAGEIVEGRLYGRGSTDMKGGVAALVMACLAERETLRDGPGVVLLITAAEETGSEGARALAAETGFPRPGALVVAEPTSNRPLSGHKGALWLRLVAQGVTAHGSMPERGVNAIYKAARLIERLEGFDFATPSHPVMGAPSLNVGTVSGGLNINSVPDRAEIGVDIRSVAGLDHADLRARLEEIVGDDARIEPMVDLPPVWTDPQDPWMRSVFAASEAVSGTPARPESVSYFTDASIFTPAYDGLPTVILGPGEPALAHQTDEYCEIAKLHDAVEIYRMLIRDWKDRP